MQTPWVGRVNLSNSVYPCKIIVLIRMTESEIETAMSTVMGKKWAENQRKRQEDMAELYKLDERDKEGPNQGTYTGLYQEILVYEKWRKKFFPMGEVCPIVQRNLASR